MPMTDDGIDAAVYLSDLCRSLSDAKLRHKGVELTFIECPLKLNAIRCWRLGMIVSELIADASRHAFYRGGGKVQVELTNRDDFVRCTVADNGSGLKDSAPGRGLKILQSLVRDLDGTIDHSSDARGTRITLSFPLCETDLGDLLAVDHRKDRNI